jgi:peptide/nickel transport system substrate-binding protein
VIGADVVVAVVPRPGRDLLAASSARDGVRPLKPRNREGYGRTAAPPIERAIERGGRPMRLARVVPLLTTILLLGVVGPAQAQTFVFGAEGEPVSFDPAIITDGVSQRVTTQVYDNLVRYKGATTDVEPALAEKWDVSEDGKVWTLYIRKNVKFHDGEPLDAKAVVWNFERWWKEKHPQHENQLKAGQTFEYWEGQFDGFDEKSIVSKVEAVDSHTVRVTLKQPQAPFLSNLAIFSFGIASPKAVEKWGTEYGKHPVGTGAFKFVEWKPNQEVVLEANPDYWGAKAKVKRVVVRNIKDNSQRLAALKAGEIHGMFGLNPDDIKVVKADTNLMTLPRPANNTGYIAINYHVKEFTDKRVRQAIAHAINKKAIIDGLYGGTGLVAKEFQPPALWGYNKDLKDFEYSPEKARDLLKQAGFPNGFSEITWQDGKKEPLVFWYMPVSRPYYPTPKEIGEAIGADLAKVGIKAQLQTVEWAVYLDKRKNGQLPIYMIGWTGDNGDPDNFICYFFCNPGAAREGFYSNPPLSDVLKRAAVLTKKDERAALYRQAEQMIHDDVARIFIA